MWIGPREIHGVTFGGVTDSSPPDSRSKAGIDGSRSVSESLAFLACFTCANWLPLLGACRASKVFILVASFHRLLRQRRAQAPRRHHPLNARFTRATHVSPPYTQSAPSPVRRFHVSWFSDCSAVRSAVLELQLQFGRFLRRSGSPQPASLLAARQKMSMTNEQRPL